MREGRMDKLKKSIKPKLGYSRVGKMASTGPSHKIALCGKRVRDTKKAILAHIRKCELCHRVVMAVVREQ